MSETRKIAAILVSDVVGYSRLAGSDEERTLAALRALRRDLIEPTVAAHNGRFVKSTGDGALVEFRSVVDSVRCALAIQTDMAERNAAAPPARRIVLRIGIHLGDVVEECDGDLMGDGVNIAARLEGIARPGAICLSEDAYRQVKARLDLAAVDLGETRLKNIAEPMRVYALEIGKSVRAKRVRPPSRDRFAVALGQGLGRLLGQLLGKVAAPAVFGVGALWLFLAGSPFATSLTPVTAEAPSATTDSARPTPPEPPKRAALAPIGHELHRAPSSAPPPRLARAAPSPDRAPLSDAAAADPHCTFAYVACRNALMAKFPPAVQSVAMADAAPPAAAADPHCTFAYVSCRNALMAKLMPPVQPVAMAFVAAPAPAREVTCSFGDGTCRALREAARSGEPARP